MDVNSHLNNRILLDKMFAINVFSDSKFANPGWEPTGRLRILNRVPQNCNSTASTLYIPLHCFVVSTCSKSFSILNINGIDKEDSVEFLHRMVLFS